LCAEHVPWLGQAHGGRGVRGVPQDSADLDDDGGTDEVTQLDLDGEGRFFDDPGTEDTGGGCPPIVDVGAYEFGDVGPQPCPGGAAKGAQALRYRRGKRTSPGAACCLSLRYGARRSVTTPLTVNVFVSVPDAYAPSWYSPSVTDPVEAPPLYSL
jgi:hypothetical protein